MKLKNLHEDVEAGSEATELLRAHLEENGIEISQQESQPTRGVLVIKRGNRWVNINVFNDGQIIAVAVPKHKPEQIAAPEWVVRAVAKTKRKDPDMLVTNFHEPDSFQEIDEFIKRQLDLDLPGPRLPKL